MRQEKVTLCQAITHSIFSLCLGAVIVLVAIKRGPVFESTSNNEKNN